jgi:hypothetical protein
VCSVATGSWYQLLPWVYGVATDGEQPRYHGWAPLLPAVGGVAADGEQTCYHGCAPLLPVVGGVAINGEQPCYHRCALLLLAASGVASMVVWCCYQPADEGQRCCRRRGALLPVDHCCKRPWRKMQATATSHLLATTVLHVMSNTDDLEFPCASPGSKEQRGKGMEVVGAMEFFFLFCGGGSTGMV